MTIRSLSRSLTGFAALPALLACATLALTACGGDSSSSRNGNDGEPPSPQPASTLRIGLLPDTQGGGNNVSMHPMRALLAFYAEQDVDLVLAVGDLSENATIGEYQQWRSVTDDFTDRMVILPVQGNHDIKGTDQDWYEYTADLIPADAVHMSGQHGKTYALVRDNVLIIAVSYGQMPFAYEFVRDTIEQHAGSVDHILLMTHNSWVGSRYGLVREKAVDAYNTSASDQRFLEVLRDYNRLFAEHDVIYIAGHEHQYSRSVLNNEYGGRFLEVVSGNASYKGYDNRFGESEQIQNMVMYKSNDSGATGALDVNASIFEITGDEMQYRAWFDTHTVFANEDGQKELANPDWKLMDRFTRTTHRCDKLVFPSSIPPGNQLNMTHDKRYRTQHCVSPNGDSARLLAGENNIFNRHDTRNRTNSITPGVSTAQSNTELLARYYRFLNIPHASYSPNLNNNDRVRLVNAGTPDEEVEIRETTIDLKKLVSLSWTGKTADTLSDILIVSGIQGQDGTYISARGVPKDITADTGLAGSRGDGSNNGKPPVTLPAGKVNSNWVLDDGDRADDYAIEFLLPENIDPASVMLAVFDEAEGHWQPVVAEQCVGTLPWDDSFLNAAPADVDAGCDNSAAVVITGTAHLWAKLDFEGRFALISR